MAKRRKSVKDVLPRKAGQGKLDVNLDVEAAVRSSLNAEAFRAPESAKGAPANTYSRQYLEREREVLETTLLEEKREMGRVSFWYFITKIAFPTVWMDHYHPVFHFDIVQQLQNLKQGEDFWAFLSREFKKSYILNILHTLWMIIRDPDIRILLIGAREDTVKPFAILIRDAFVEGTPGFEEMHRVYPDFVIRSGDRRLRQAMQFTHPLRRKALPDPTFRAAYLGVSGAGWRCDILKYDDCVERRRVSTPEQSAKSLRDMLDLLPLIHTGSQYRNVIGAGTRWVYHDPYGLIIGDNIEGADGEARKTLAGRKTKVMIRHALEHPTRACTTCPDHVTAEFPHNDFDLEEGVPPDDPVHTRQMILERYQEYCIDVNRGESLFYHQYGNICLAPSDQKFKPEWIITAPFSYWPLAKQRVLAIDSADKDLQEEGRGDHMVAIFGEYDDFGRLLMAHALRSNAWTRSAFIESMIAWMKATQWWPNKIAKEKFGGDTFLTDMRNQLMVHGRTSHFIPVTRPQVGSNYMKKLDWIVTCLQGPMERSEVVFGESFPAHIRNQASRELLNLGQIRLDDVADTMALFFAQEVRPSFLFAKTGPPKDTFKPPDLQLYGAPPSISFDDPRSPVEAAMEGKSWKSVAESLPTLNTEKPVEVPPGLALKVDW